MSKRPRENDPFGDWPTHSTMTPMGEVEGMRRLAAGALHEKAGWRRWGVLVFVAIFFAPMLIVLIAKLVNG